MLHELVLLAALRDVLLGLEGLGRPVAEEETHGSAISTRFSGVNITVSFLSQAR